MWMETLGACASPAVRHRSDQPPRLAAEGDGRDLLDAAERDHHQRDQQHGAEAEREGGAGHEVVAVPVGEHRGRPGADQVGGAGEQRRLAEGDVGHGQERQRQQQADQHGHAGDAPVVGIVDRAAPGELGLALGGEQAPIGADAAFEDLPRLVDGFDDVVFDAVGAGARDEVAQHLRLLEAAGLGVLEVIAGARPAELGDDDALAGIGLAQLVVDDDGLVDGLAGGEAFPVGQDVRGDVVDRRRPVPGARSQTFQISPVDTGTRTARLTRWIFLISSGTVWSSR